MALVAFLARGFEAVLGVLYRGRLESTFSFSSKSFFEADDQWPSWHLYCTGYRYASLEFLSGGRSFNTD